MVDEPAPRSTPARSGSVWEVFWVFLRLGLTSFGGPVAHLAYFREAFVERRKWLTDKVYADIVALCQFLPGPASSQVGMSIGLYRAGYTGLLAAWAAFTLPSAILLVAFAYGASSLDDALGYGWLIGLKAAAVAVVAYAVLGMATKLAPDTKRATIAVGALAVVLLVPGVLAQILAIVAAGIIGLLWLPSEKNEPVEQDSFRVGLVRRSQSEVSWYLLLFLSVCRCCLPRRRMKRWTLPTPSIEPVPLFSAADTLFFRYWR